MLQSVAAECYKRKTTLQIANATNRLERSIKATIQQEHIDFIVSDVISNAFIKLIVALDSKLLFREIRHKIIQWHTSAKKCTNFKKYILKSIQTKPQTPAVLVHLNRCYIL